MSYTTAETQCCSALVHLKLHLQKNPENMEFRNLEVVLKMIIGANALRKRALSTQCPLQWPLAHNWPAY